MESTETIFKTWRFYGIGKIYNMLDDLNFFLLKDEFLYNVYSNTSDFFVNYLSKLLPIRVKA